MFHKQFLSLIAGLGLWAAAAAGAEAQAPAPDPYPVHGSGNAYAYATGSYGAHVGGPSTHYGHIGSKGTARIYGSKRSRYRAPQRCWVPGRWVTQVQKVWIPATTQKVWIEAVYETRFDSCGVAIQVLISPGRWDTVCTPGYWGTEQVRTWQPGHWS